jgi:DNA polymerase
MIISIDFETRSTIDLRQVGVYRYAEDPDTDVWWHGVQDRRWACPYLEGGEPYPFEGITPPPLFRLDAGFERTIWNKIMHAVRLAPRAAGVVDDTAAAAAYLALPRALEKSAKVLSGRDGQKDMAGPRLCLQMARPRRMVNGSPVWWHDKAKLEALYAYCKQDVVVESAIREKVWPGFPEFEQNVWRLDQKMK